MLPGVWLSHSTTLSEVRTWQSASLLLLDHLHGGRVLNGIEALTAGSTFLSKKDQSKRERLSQEHNWLSADVTDPITES